jgi:RNA polymerase sigma-70 factor (ECF subfamily)
MGLGDKAEFTDFVQRHEPRLRVSLMAAYGPDRGREAAAEALAYAWEHWEQVRDMKQPIGYLYRVGQSKSRPRLTPRPDPIAHSTGEAWVEPALPTALGRLSRNQRLAVVLVHAYGWRQREAADVMEMSEATVRTHLQRGLTKLRSSMGVSSNA